jgi:hypothetical protein
MQWPGPEFDGMDLDEDPPEDANLKRVQISTETNEEKIPKKSPRRKKSCAK